MVIIITIIIIIIILFFELGSYNIWAHLSVDTGWSQW